jgi:hypothetical protein
VALTASTAEAQTSGFSFRGFADVGSTMFTAQQSFEAILGSARGPVFGGGVEMIERNVFLDIRASRFQQRGERVFVSGGERFGLGIPTTITVTPIELTGGYRFDWGSRLIPYAGIGYGRYRYKERSEFAEGDENVEQSFNGFQLLGAAEFRLSRLFGAAFEAQWSSVPDALGTDDNGVSNAFNETNLGGTTIRAKFVIGR